MHGTLPSVVAPSTPRQASSASLLSSNSMNAAAAGQGRSTTLQNSRTAARSVRGAGRSQARRPTSVEATGARARWRRAVLQVSGDHGGGGMAGRGTRRGERRGAWCGGEQWRRPHALPSPCDAVGAGSNEKWRPLPRWVSFHNPFQRPVYRSLEACAQPRHCETHQQAGGETSFRCRGQRGRNKRLPQRDSPISANSN
jgi:hypothetical protein